jgi:hypothetical protein
MNRQHAHAHAGERTATTAALPRLARAATCALLLGWSGAAAAGDHVAEVCLGWTGGAAGSGYKWVAGAITWQGDHATIHYDWAGIGTMTGRLKDGILRGNWSQERSSGGFYFSLPSRTQDTALGKWWSAGTPNTRNGMTVTTDTSRCQG